MVGLSPYEQHQAAIREKLLQLAARRGSPELSICTEAFVNRCMKITRQGEDVGALNPRQIRCIENEWRDLVEPTLAKAPTINASGQGELSI